MTNSQLSRALFGLCRRHICANYQETKLIEEAARRLQDLGEMERPDAAEAPGGNAERCVCCGAVIPEGWQYCPECMGRYPGGRQI